MSGKKTTTSLSLEHENAELRALNAALEKRLADAELILTQTNLSALIENADGSIWSVDAHYGLILGNQMFHRNVSAPLGRRLEKGESVLLPCFPPQAIAEWKGYYDRALQGESFSVETQTRFREIPRYIEYRFSPLREEDGGIRGVTVFGRDVTDRKQAEKEISRLARFPSENPNPILRVSHNGRLLYANKPSAALLQLWNCREGESLPQEWAERISVSAASGETSHIDVNCGDKVFSMMFVPVVGEDYVNLYATDITERKQVEEALRASEDKFRQAFNTSPVALSISRLKGGEFVSINRSFEQMSGYSEAEIIGKTALEIHLWKNPQTHKDLLKELREKGEVIDYETPILTRSGEIYCLTSASLIEINGEPHVLTLAVDITERKRAEDALRKSQMQIQAIMDYSPALISIKDLNGNVIQANRSFDVLDAPPLHEFIGKNVFDLFPREVAQQLWNNDLAALQAKAAIRSEEVVRHKDGTWHTYWTVKFPIYLQSDQPFGVCAISNDITERKHAEKELRLKDELLHMTSEMAKIGGWEFDPQTLEGTWTDAVAIIHDLDPGNPTNVNLGVGFYLPDSRRQIEQAIQNAIQFALPYDLELQMVTAKGNPKWVRTMGMPILEDGKVVKIRGIFQDITEQKKSQQQLLNMFDELKRSNAELEQFAYVASHDLQEPLRTVAGMVQLLQQRYKGQLDERADEYINLAFDGATRMQRLINDLLAYSRVDRRNNPMQPVDANLALKSALRNLEASIAAHGAAVTSDSLPTVEADATQLTQLFQNLIGNAIKFHSERPPSIHIGAEKLGDFWRFFVCDNGIGIEPQYFERVFLVFQRLHTRREYPGTGIGLSICKKIVERHGGRIWVESEPGQGATFYFTIPSQES